MASGNPLQADGWVSILCKLLMPLIPKIYRLFLTKVEYFRFIKIICCLDTCPSSNPFWYSYKYIPCSCSAAQHFCFHHILLLCVFNLSLGLFAPFSSSRHLFVWILNDFFVWIPAENKLITFRNHKLKHPTLRRYKKLLPFDLDTLSDKKIFNALSKTN